MHLYKLGKVLWDESQLIYHALAKMGREALCLVSPSTPYVCIGFHQQAESEVDMEYCSRNRVPVFRREVGGGAVYLDGNQYFFQLILHKDNPMVPKSKVAFYKKFIQPVINVYRRVGIPAEYKAVNDVITGSRKISGSGAGEIGDCIVFVGNLIMDFNYEMMSKILRVPDEKFRDKIYQTLEANLSTIRRELGEENAAKWSESILNDMLAEEFQTLIGPLESCDRDQLLDKKVEELRTIFITDDRVSRKVKENFPNREVKIRAGTRVFHRLHKAPGGLIRADFEVNEDRYGKISLSGDFFCYPEAAVRWLERSLSGKPVEKSGELIGILYSEKGVETPGIEIDDWIKVLAV
jgi:lipoate-protein ligase A